MTKPICVVYAALGVQGASVVDALLHSERFAVRAVTSNKESDAAKALAARGVEVVQADRDKAEEIHEAAKGAEFMFANTISDKSREKEEAHGKMMADAAKAAGTTHMVWSTLPFISKISEGKITGAHEFDSKAKVQEYIESLGLSATFLSVGNYMSNFEVFKNLWKNKDGSLTLMSFIKPDQPVPMIDARKDTGPLVLKIFDEMETYKGKTVHACFDLCTYNECADLMTEVGGEKVTYRFTEPESMKGKIPEPGMDMVLEMCKFINEYPFEKSGNGVEEARKMHPEYTTMKAYLEKHPVPSILAREDLL